MTLSYVHNEHREIVENWWGVQDWPPIPASMLPKTGFIQYGALNEPLVACWVYVNNSALWFLEWTVGNPAASKEKRSEAINALYKYVVEWSKNEGAEVLFTMVKHPGLIKRLKESHNFEETDTGMTHLLRRL